MSDSPVDSRSSISRQWIKAHVLGGIAFNAVPVVAYLVIQWAGITTGNISSFDFLVIAIGFVAAYSISFVVLGYLSGLVLRQKLPLFPMRAWLLLFVLFGVIAGPFAAMAWQEEARDLDKMGFDDLTVLAVAIPVAGIAGILIGLTAGVLQALVLRNTAQGLRTWVLYSALAGLSIIVWVPSIVYLPAYGLTEGILEAAVGLVATVAGAFIMLPAVHQVRPRH